jgi:hypothetical protein
MTSRTPGRLAEAFAREDASRDHPEVVDRVPPRARPKRPVASKDVLARLPKL